MEVLKKCSRRIWQKLLVQPSHSFSTYLETSGGHILKNRHANDGTETTHIETIAPHFYYPGHLVVTV